MAPVAAVICGKHPDLVETMVKQLAPKIDGE